MYSPVPICATMDDVDVKFEACVVKYVFPLESAWVHKSSNATTWNQKPTDEARIDERASLVASFVVPYAAPIPLRGLVDTGSGMSILTFSAFNRVAVQTGAMLKPYQIDLYAANGETIRTMGMEECVRFQLGGYELKTNFVVVVDSKGVEDFLLGRNVLRACQVLVDLTSMKIVVRAPVQPVWHHANIQVGDPTFHSSGSSRFVFNQFSVQPFGSTIMNAKVVTTDLEPLILQTVVLNASIAEASLKMLF